MRTTFNPGATTVAEGNKFLTEEVKMLGKKFLRLALIMGVALAIVLSGSQIAAASSAVTQGDVQATLQSWNTARLAILINSHSVAAAQLDGFTRGRIRPSGDGEHYCVQDWHVILVAYITGGDQSFTYQDAVAELSPIETTYILDGVSLPVTETPVVRRTLSTPGDVQYGFAAASIVSPSAVGVGAHTLTWIVSDPFGTETTNITIYMDAAGTGACVQ
jgi:hypothetical protein